MRIRLTLGMWRQILAVGFAWAALALSGNPAWAHKIRLFATVEGTAIVGSVFVAGGGAVTATVTVRAADNRILQVLTTDEAGHFRFQASERIDHHLTADAGAGHRADLTIAAADLPPALPVPGGGPSGVSPAVAAPAGMAAAVPAGREDGLAELVDETVARHVRPLREQLDAFENEIRLRDILGGLGYLLGLAGVGALVAARRRPPPRT